MILFDVAIIILLFSLFGITHSILASTKIKEKIIEQVGERIAFYRLFYNIISLITFLVVYELSPKPDVRIYDLHYPFDILILGIQILGLIGFFWSASFIDSKEFLGISQIIRYMNSQYDCNDKDEKLTMIKRGPFRYVRHPIYFFSIVFLSGRPEMDLFYAVFLFCMISYFIIGSYREEKKLIEIFGVEYTEYQKNTARLIPLIY